MIRIHPTGVARRVARYLHESGTDQKWSFLLIVSLVVLGVIALCTVVIRMSLR